MKVLLLFIALILPSTVFANSYIICGQTASFDDGMTVTGYELELSSEDDNYSGPVGKNWNLKLKENGEWLKPNDAVVATSLEKDGDVTVRITIAAASSVTGPVGSQYVLTNLFDEEPVLEKFTMGGFAGSVKIGTFHCVGAYD